MGRKNFFKKLQKYIPAALGAVGGTLLGGPVGGMIGGSLGGASTRGKGNKLKGALKGAALAGAYSAGAPMVFEGLGGAPLGGGFWAQATGANGPSLLSQLGVSSAPKLGGGLGFYGNFGGSGVMQGGGGLLSSLGGKGGSSGLGGLASKFMGGSGSTSSMSPGTQGASYDPFSGMSSSVSPVQGLPLNLPGEEGGGSEEDNIRTIVANSNASALEKLMKIIEELSAKNPGPRRYMPISQAEAVREFKRGGYVSGDSGGQDDDVYMDLPEGAYVQNATTVSLLGDGNSENGRRKLMEWENSVLGSKLPPKSQPARTIKAKVSPGEFIHSREFVDLIGNGKNSKGAKVLDNFNKNVRTHKGVTKFLPPKSKPISHYAGGRVH